MNFVSQNYTAWRSLDPTLSDTLFNFSASKINSFNPQVSPCWIYTASPLKFRGFEKENWVARLPLLLPKYSMVVYVANYKHQTFCHADPSTSQLIIGALNCHFKG